jgi:hypothetical protein
VALREARVGNFISADTAPGGFFAPTISTVRTSTASITVAGGFSTARGSGLVLEDMSESGLHLCVSGARASCAPVVGEWSGVLHDTPAATRAFDFYGHGLTSQALGGWLVLGLFMSIACLVAIGARVSENSDGRQRGKPTAGEK